MRRPNCSNLRWIKLQKSSRTRSSSVTDVSEFDHDGLVYEKNGLKVIAFEVDHGDVIKPCYGYRFEYGGCVAVFSSGTRYNQNVIKYGKGADLLVHEVAMARPELMKAARVNICAAIACGRAANSAGCIVHSIFEQPLAGRPPQFGHGRGSAAQGRRHVSVAPRGFRGQAKCHG
jgi:hypothetical protein